MRKNTFGILTYVLVLSLFNFPINSEDLTEQKKIEEKLYEIKNKQNKVRKYMVGPGDQLYINFIDVNEYSGSYLVGPDGNISLPEIKQINIEDFTLDEINTVLEARYSKYIKNPKFLISIEQYRPIKVFIKGEVKRPGFYTLTGSYLSRKQKIKTFNTQEAFLKEFENDKFTNYQNEFDTFNSFTNFPTLYESLRAAQGITPYSDLTKVNIIRKQTISNGGGFVEADINFLEFLTSEITTSNIRIFDGDIIKIAKSDKLLTEQLLEATDVNLNPDEIVVYVSGNIEKPGAFKLPQGSSLNHAIARSGGRKDLSGKVNFVRLSKNGELKKRTFSYSDDAELGKYRNPLLMSGDIINVDKSGFKKFTTVFKEVTQPFLGVYSVYKLFD